MSSNPQLNILLNYEVHGEQTAEKEHVRQFYEWKEPYLSIKLF